LPPPVFEISPGAYLLWPSTADGTYEEDFWEYISGVLFREKDYFVSSFNLGGGDISAYLIPDYQRKLRKAGIISQGAFLEELEIAEKGLQISPTFCQEVTIDKAEKAVSTVSAILKELNFFYHGK